MSANPRVPRDAAAEESAKNAELRDNFSAHYSKGVERMAEIQKRSIDLAMQHNKETIELWKQVMEKMPWAPRLNMFDQATGTLERFADNQKIAVDLMVEQARAFVDMAKERTTVARTSTEAVLNFAQQTFDRSVTAQKKAAKTTVSETRSAYENAREHFGFPGNAVADSIQHGVDAMVEAQKELLETVSR